MRNFRAICPEVATSAARNEVRNYVLLGKAFLWGFIAPAYQTIQPPWDPEESLGITIVTERFIRETQPTRGDGVRVAVDGDEATFGTERLQDARAVPPAPECGIDVNARRLHGKSGKHFVDKHRLVLIQTP
jgi:hypothetical protein